MAEMLDVTGWAARIAARVGALVARADRAVCAGQDERARRHGWTVTRTGFGSRRYRDPRFDALRAARTGGRAYQGAGSQDVVSSQDGRPQGARPQDGRPQVGRSQGARPQDGRPQDGRFPEARGGSPALRGDRHVHA
ncbi:hypothetical protein [Nonomuraea candida]|uniref:hypothetical protein n=1 Tax=Nonomuraea candida TaxID=359159 RepID=UPI0014702E72|nr:hypothetical protein [Nonomuraea candida]